MSFDSNQSAYKDLREIIAQRTDPIVAWVGAGLSMPAGLPSWAAMKESLLGELNELANQQTDPKVRHDLKYSAGLANVEKNFWEAFSILRDQLGPQTYAQSIRGQMGAGDRAKVPATYLDLWKLGIRGMLSLNIDPMAKRAYSEVFPGKVMHDFSSNTIGQHIHLQRKDRPWLANLHGQLDDQSSWVFTTSDLKRLFADSGYQALITGCLTTRTVIFVGITADDIAAGGHLANLTRQKIDCGGHYWITHRNDAITRRWAEEAGLRVIVYSPDNDHAELGDIFADLHRYVPRDDEPIPVRPEIAASLSVLPSPSDLARQTSSEIRDILNSHAAAILQETTLKTAAAFEAFAQEYADAIYRGWRVTTKAPNDYVLGYHILEKCKTGAFGDVFRAESPSGETVAVKVLHERVREDMEMLHCFRRGVKSMQILTHQEIQGVVRCRNASEIPAVVVMDFIEGLDLQEAVQKGVLKSWTEVLRVAADLTKIIRTSHRLPQRVLHRDIRPANVMLENCWGPNPDWDLVRLWVLDFDLSWHIDAFDVSVSQPGTANGYLSPEQAERNSGVSTRNAAVDSFGIGMTFYFFATRDEPRFGEQRYSDWADTLRKAAEKTACREWRSLPKRYFRLVQRATQDRQSERLDMFRFKTKSLFFVKFLKIQAACSPLNL